MSTTWKTFCELTLYILNFHTPR